MKTKYFFSLVSIILLFDSILISQVNQEWVQRYNGPGTGGYDRPVAMAIDASENIYITGYSVGVNYDYVTIKYSSSGVQQWAQRYNGPANSNDVPTAMFVDANGYVYVTGYSYGSGSSYDYATIKYGPDGVVQWIQRYNGPANLNDYAAGIFAASNGSVFVTGTSQGSGTGTDYATVKYNSQGIQQWVIRYDDSANGNESAVAVASDDFNAIYVTGTGWNGVNNDIVTIKYDFNGGLLWRSSYNGIGNGNDGADAIYTDINGYVYICGYSAGIGTGLDYITLKYLSSGVLQWNARQNGLGNLNDEAKSITLDYNGNVFVTGYQAGNGTGFDIGTYKYNNLGSLQWTQRYNLVTSTDEIGYSIAADADGNCYVTGVNYVLGEYNNYITIKYNYAGAMQWVANYNGPGSGVDSAFVVKVDPASGNVYVTGVSYGSSSTGYDITTIKYSQIVSVKNHNSNLPAKFELYQNYPNPFNPKTVIRYDLPKDSYVEIAVTDVLGRKIASLVNQTMKAGGNRIEFDGSNYPSGIYFYSLKAGNYTQTKKLILLK